jgi:hypothetical protein
MSKARTDTERLDFLQRQRITRWVGYSGWQPWTDWNGNPSRIETRAMAPVFPGDDLRKAIDREMDAAESFKYSDEYRRNQVIHDPGDEDRG